MVSLSSHARPEPCQCGDGLSFLEVSTALGSSRNDLSVKLDGSSFPAATKAALIVIDGVHSLSWSRGNDLKADLSGQPARRSG